MNERQGQTDKRIAGERGELSDADRRRFDEATRDMSALADRLNVELPADVEQRVQARLGRALAAHRRRWVLPTALGSAVAAAVAVAAVWLAIVSTSRQVEVELSAAEAVAAYTLDVDAGEETDALPIDPADRRLLAALDEVMGGRDAFAAELSNVTDDIETLDENGYDTGLFSADVLKMEG